MFLRHVTNTKKTRAYMDDACDYEVNCNGIRFMYTFEMNICLAIRTIAFKNEASIRISLFNDKPPGITYIQANSGLSVGYSNYKMCWYTTTIAAGSYFVVDFSSPRHDLLRNLRAITICNKRIQPLIVRAHKQSVKKGVLVL